MEQRTPIWISPAAVAVAIASAITCLAMYGSRVPVQPPPAPHAVRALSPRMRLRRVALRRPIPSFPAGRWLTVLPVRPPQATIRVLLSDVLQDGRLRVVSESGILVINPETHAILAQVPAGQTYCIRMTEDARAIAGPGSKDFPCDTVRLIALDPSGPMNTGDRSFLGALEVRLGHSGLEVINEVREEDYIAGVVAGESARSFPLEALRAQAVAARTYALSQRGHREAGVDVVDTIADQVYTGAARVWPDCRKAVESTAGEILSWHGRPIIAYFSADCGGHTRSSVAAGLTKHDLPYLRAVPDGPAGGPAYCSQAPSHTWSVSLSSSSILPKLNEALGTRLSSITDIRVVGHYADDRAADVEIDGEEQTCRDSGGTEAGVPEDGETATAGSDADPPADQSEASSQPSESVAPVRRHLVVRATEFRRIIGLDVLRSQTMTAQPNGDGTWLFEGRGYGHGVGLCQWGAAGMARRGIAYARILAHYYRGVRLEAQPPRHGALRGFVVDSIGKAVAHADVMLAGTDRRVSTDARGRFLFPSIPAATYDIIVTPPAGPAEASFAWTVTQGASTKAKIRLG